jgi:hypothetical protein
MKRQSRRMVNSEWRMGDWRDGKAGQFLQGPGRVAGFHGACRGMLSSYTNLPQGGNVWPHQSNPPCIFIGARQHPGRSWARTYGLLHSVSPHRARVFEGTGNPSDSFGKGRYRFGIGDRTFDRSMRIHRPHDARAHPGAAETSMTPIRHSPFAIRYSPFALERNSND